MPDLWRNFFMSNWVDIFQTIGIVATIVFSAVSLSVNMKSLFKTTYVNQITSLKEKYISNLREHLAEYGSLALECSKAVSVAGYTTELHRNELIRDLDLKWALVTLYLNSENPIDRKLENYLQEIRLSATNPEEVPGLLGLSVGNLLKYSQQVLLFEWRNLKREAKHGPMKDSEIDDARENFLNRTQDI